MKVVSSLYLLDVGVRREKEEVLEGIFLFYIHCTLRVSCSFSMIFFMIFHFLFPGEVQSF